MGEECRYYYYDAGYSCALKREKEGYSSISSDDVHRYCWGYHYEECPRYKRYGSSGGCFLTTACVEAKGLPDDCDELQTLRSFRDTYLRSLDGGEEEIAEYYLAAPKIVESIKKRSDSAMVFDKIYNELVKPCVALIKAGDNQGAHELYKSYTLHLKQEYI